MPLHTLRLVATAGLLYAFSRSTDVVSLVLMLALGAALAALGLVLWTALQRGSESALPALREAYHHATARRTGPSSL